DGLELAAAAEAGIFSTAFASSLRTGTQTLLSIHGNLWGAIQSASQPLVSGNQQIKNVDSQLQSLKMEIDRLSQERANAEQASADARAKAIDEQNEGHRRAQQTRQRAQATLMRIAVQESEIDQRLKNLLVERQRLSDNVIKAQMKLYAGSIQQLRASTPFLTGNVRLERFSKAAQKGYLVIG